MNYEKITGTILKNWFVNAYIDLEKNKALLTKLAVTDLEKTDINNVIYCMKSIVENLEDTPENADCISVLDTATQIAKTKINSYTSLHLYHYLAIASQYSKSLFTPVDVIEIITKLSDTAKTEIINNSNITIADIFITAKEQCTFLDSTLDIESTCQCLITAGQITLMETLQQEKTLDYKVAIACVIFSALEYAWKEKEFTSNVVSQMLSDLVNNNAREKDTSSEEHEFQLIYSIETTIENMEKIKRNIERSSAKALIVGTCGPFNIGNWTILAETKTPLMVLPVKTPFSGLTIKTTHPIKLDTYSNIRQENNIISIFERIKPQDTQEADSINIIASIQNLSLLEPISRTNARVIYNLDSLQTLENILETIESKTVVLMPSTENDLQIMNELSKDNEKSQNIIIANTSNDLEIKYLCEEIAIKQEIIKEHINAQSLVSYIHTLLYKQRTLTVENEYENIYEDISNFIDDSDSYVSVLINAKEILFLQQRIEEIIYTKNPNIHLEIIVGDTDRLLVNAH